MRATVLACAACALLLPACGSGAAAPPAPVRLQVTAPADLRTVRDATVEIRGSVRPAGAAVLVHGRRAAVSGGTFRARVGLDAGVNVIDVLASAGAARPALTAVRVRRLVPVAVPDVQGLAADEARATLEAAGLKADTQRTGGFLDELLPGTPSVCATEPVAGTRLDPGATVKVVVSRRC